MYAFEASFGSTLTSAGIRRNRSVGCFVVGFLVGGPSGVGASGAAVVVGDAEGERLRFLAGF